MPTMMKKIESTSSTNMNCQYPDGYVPLHQLHRFHVKQAFVVMEFDAEIKEKMLLSNLFALYKSTNSTLLIDEMQIDDDLLLAPKCEEQAMRLVMHLRNSLILVAQELC